MNTIPVTKLKYDLLSAKPVTVLAVVAVLALALTLPLLDVYILAAASSEIAYWLGLYSLFPFSLNMVPQYLPLLAVFFIGYKLLRKRANRIDQETQLAAMAKAASSPVQLHSFISRKSGIAIAGNTLLIVREGKLGAIPLEAIRKAWWDIPGRDVVSAYGASPVVAWQVGMANKIAKEEADANSGFYFEVSDIANPLWFFHCTDASILRRWNEVIKQAFERTDLKEKAA
ncbi:hypothetical protein [Microvirga sp. Mcv34]|uniref:hypothetical protein n=1 Tax=Microvirga sp. Mcv34 TaxID=2926016 RepID=UPI0021C67912|nr:hypothetical protein [Microvirga sp. Mcv34]